MRENLYFFSRVARWYPFLDWITSRCNHQYSDTSPDMESSSFWRQPHDDFYTFVTPKVKRLFLRVLRTNPNQLKLSLSRLNHETQNTSGCNNIRNNTHIRVADQSIIGIQTRAQLELKCVSVLISCGVYLLR